MQFGQYHGAGVVTGFGLRLRHTAQRYRLPRTAVFVRTCFPLRSLFSPKPEAHGKYVDYTAIPLRRIGDRMTARHALSLFLPRSPAMPRADPKPFPGTPTKWQGFAKHDFNVAELEATVVVPEQALPGRPWVWRAEFFGSFADCDVALVKAGWHLAYLKVPDLFGAPKAVKKWEAFYNAMVKDFGMHLKPGLIGLSRGGLYCMNWAAAHADKTLAVYRTTRCVTSRAARRCV